MLTKLMSGRWILTVASAVIFVYAVAKGILDAATTATILMFVFKSYFDKGDRNEPNGNGTK